MGIFRKKYDCFVSYRSKNVDVARQIADQLIASGRKIWFAEYEVLLTDRQRFQEAIDCGIRECQYGLVLTNDDYANSNYCEAEMLQLLKVCGPKKIMEIMIPSEPMTHLKYPQLSESPTYVFTGDIDEALRFAGQTLGWKIAPQIKMAPESPKAIFKGQCLDDTYTIDVTGWTSVDKSFYGGGPCYTRKIEGFDVFWNLQFGEEIDPRVYEARLGIDQRDERALYNHICDFARCYFGDMKPGYRVTGAHLLYYKGQSQFAVTYYDGRFWRRRYSLMLVHPDTYRAAEFVFTFQFRGVFRQYCRYVKLMDDLVMSLQWGGNLELTSKDTLEIPVVRPSEKDDRLLRIIEDQPIANKFNQEGLSLAKRGLLRDAVSAWENVLKYTTLVELRGGTLYNMGLAYEKMGDMESALRCYKESAEANPQQSNSLCNVGSIYIQQGQPQDALKYLLAAAELSPHDYITLNNIVVCYNDLGKDAESASWLLKLRALKR